MSSAAAPEAGAPAGRIHQVGYRRLPTPLRPGGLRCWPITRRGLRALLQRSRFLRWILWLAWAPVVVQGVRLYLSSTAGRLGPFGQMLANSEFLRIDAEFFLDSLLRQTPLMWLALLSCARLISDDLKAGALQVYLAKPLSRYDYILGKAGVVGSILGLVVVLPGLAVCAASLAFSSGSSYLGSHWWIVPSLLGFAAFLVVTLTLVVLGVSSLSRNGAFVTVLLLGTYLFSGAVARVLHAIYDRPWLALFALWDNYKQVGYAIFGLPTPLPVSPWASALVTIGLAWLMGALLLRRVRAVEIVR